MDFKNTILIMTSNIGANYLLEGIRDDGSIDEKCQELTMNDLKAHFRPEFLNRLDEIIMFKPLTKQNIRAIIDLLIADVNRRLEEKELRIEEGTEDRAHGSGERFRRGRRVRPDVRSEAAEEISAEECGDTCRKADPRRKCGQGRCDPH